MCEILAPVRAYRAEGVESAGARGRGAWMMEPNDFEESVPAIEEQLAALDLASLEDLLDAVLVELAFRIGPAWFDNPATWN